MLSTTNKSITQTTINPAILNTVFIFAPESALLNA
jgi:hypothetical protein